MATDPTNTGLGSTAFLTALDRERDKLDPGMERLRVEARTNGTQGGHTVFFMHTKE